MATLKKRRNVMRMAKIVRILLLVVFVAGLTAMAQADTLEDIIQRGELRVAVQTQGPPFSFVDKNGERTGSSVEFCKLMAQEMGVKVVFLDYDWDGLIPALLSKKADILAADMTAKLGRALKVSFTNPFYTTGQVMYVKAGSSIKSAADANKPEITVATLLGSSYTETAKKHMPKAKIKEYKGGGNIAMNAVVAGHADVGVADLSSVNAMAATYPPGTLTILPTMLSYEPLSFAVRPEDRHLLEWVNLFFDWIRADGRYDANMKYWVETTDWKADH
jgi:polar amino acid transport system substrate-binding protein